MRNINPIKFFLSLMVVAIFRLTKGFGMPNIEPVMGTTMPFAKQGGVIAGFLFAFVSIALFDVVSGTYGIWTVVNAFTYGAIGCAAGLWFKNREFSRSNSIGFAVVGTIIYDLVTGVIATPLMFPMTFSQAFVGQIPFTLYHLLGNIACAAVLSPLLYRYIMQNPRFAWKGEEAAHA